MQNMFNLHWMYIYAQGGLQTRNAGWNTRVPIQIPECINIPILRPVPFCDIILSFYTNFKIKHVCLYFHIYILILFFSHVILIVKYVVWLAQRICMPNLVLIGAAGDHVLMKRMDRRKEWWGYGINKGYWYIGFVWWHMQIVVVHVPLK